MISNWSDKAFNVNILKDALQSSLGGSVEITLSVSLKNECFWKVDFL